jgi:hypothetical protein
MIARGAIGQSRYLRQALEAQEDQGRESARSTETVRKLRSQTFLLSASILSWLPSSTLSWRKTRRQKLAV